MTAVKSFSLALRPDPYYTEYLAFVIIITIVMNLQGGWQFKVRHKVSFENNAAREHFVKVHSWIRRKPPYVFSNLSRCIFIHNTVMLGFFVRSKQIWEISYGQFLSALDKSCNFTP